MPIRVGQDSDIVEPPALVSRSFAFEQAAGEIEYKPIARVGKCESQVIDDVAVKRVPKRIPRRASGLMSAGGGGIVLQAQIVCARLWIVGKRRVKQRRATLNTQAPAIGPVIGIVPVPAFQDVKID